MRTLRNILVVVLCLWLTGIPEAAAAVIIPASLTPTDVNAAITTAVNGDTVALPPGAATWNAGAVTVPNSKGITLDGSAGVTITKGTGVGGALLVNLPSSTTYGTRVTGFTFSGAGSNYIDIGYDFNNRFAGAKFRVDHNTFTDTTVAAGLIAVRVLYSFGLMDHNTFTGDDGSEMVQNQAWPNPDQNSGSGGWGPPTIDSSAIDAVYLADNTFQKLTQTTSDFRATTAFNQFGGSRTIAINNTIIYCQMDAHGTFTGGVEYVGSRWFYIKGNHWFMPTGSHAQSLYGDLRAGSGVWANNTLGGGTNTQPGGGLVQLRYEDSGATYRAKYQIGADYSTNSTFVSPNYYATNQTGRGVWLFGNDSGFTIVNQTTALIQLNRDYFLLDPGLTDPPYPNPLSIPSTPTSPTGTVISSSAITFGWTIPAQNQLAPQQGVYVERSLSGLNSWTVVNTATATATSFADTGLLQSTAYDYRARSFDHEVTSAYTSIVTKTTNSSSTPTSPLLRGSKSGVPGFTF